VFSIEFCSPLSPKTENQPKAVLDHDVRCRKKKRFLSETTACHHDCEWYGSWMIGAFDIGGNWTSVAMTKLTRHGSMDKTLHDVVNNQRRRVTVTSIQ
jgi:hypothetical protein